MTASSTNAPLRPETQSRDELLAACRATEKVCGYLSRILSEHAARQKTIQHVLRTVNFVVGIAVVLLTLLALVPSFQPLAGQQAVAVLALVAAVVLLADAALPSILPEPNPERFKDYALYIRSYAQELKGLETDATLTNDAWRARILELVRLARMNLDDVFRQWPWLVRKLEACGCKEYWQE